MLTPTPPTTRTPDGAIVVLTHADTDVLAISAIRPTLHPDLPPVVAANVGTLRDAEEAVSRFEALVPQRGVVLVRLHGGAQSLPGFDDLVRLVAERGSWLVAMSGVDELDPELMARSNVGIDTCVRAKAYLEAGGLENHRRCLAFLSDHLLATGIGWEPPLPQPRSGLYHPHVPEGTLEAWRRRADPARPTIGVLFYRSYWFAGDTDFVDVLVTAGEALGANVLPVYAYSLRDRQGADGPPEALRLFLDDGRPTVDVVVHTMAFAMGASSADARADGDPAVDVLRAMDVPQIQAINASASNAAWTASDPGLSPLDVAVNVAIPELDGRIVGVPVGFKESVPLEDGSDLTVIRHRGSRERADRLMGLAVRLAALRRTPNAEKRVAIVFSNHHAKVARIANAVGLDSPASVLSLLHRLRDTGYTVEDIPPDADALMDALIERGHYDDDVLTEEQLRNATVRIPAARYRAWFAQLPADRQAEMRDRWGEPPGSFYVDAGGTLGLAGLRFGNVFLAVQPPRGYGMDKTAAMHQPDLPPPHPYHALYRWLAEPVELGGFGAHAVVQVGKHGSLEWLPGKGVGVSSTCYPDLFLGSVPLIYPFIIDGPGEGAAAKRRTHATIVDHLPPAMTTAGAYGDMVELDRVVDEYYLLERTDPDKLPVLRHQIWEILKRSHLDREIPAIVAAADGDDHAWDSEEDESGLPASLAALDGFAFSDLVEDIHAYTHELSAAPIREGLHVLGRVPAGEPLVEMVLMIVRLQNGEIPSLRAALAAAYGLDAVALAEDAGARVAGPIQGLADDAGQPVRTNGQALDALDTVARGLLRATIGGEAAPLAADAALALVAPSTSDPAGRAQAARTLGWVGSFLLPALRRSTDEVDHVLAALEGRFVPPGPSGAITRGMAHALPTGRNFYAIDPRALPSPTAWIVGQRLADGVLARYLRDQGKPAETVGLSIWGTAAMRTSGEDIAQVLALLGVRPTWQAESRRISGIELVPLAELGRSRVDVVCRISGFFRDAFPTAIALLDEAFELVADADEPPDQNPIRAHRLAMRDRLRAEGHSDSEAWERAGYRLFGSPPGVYGVGILHQINERDWQDVGDFATTYLAWGGYAYTREAHGVPAKEAFGAALAAIDVAVKNQDNREHDIFDSDDYLQFHGGMVAAARALSGRAPQAYVGDTHDPGSPRVRGLKEEADRVFRTRVMNPKWIASMRRHGYRGATELTATVDYLFGYDATAGVVDDWQYAAVAEEYALDPQNQAFFRASNPWALRDITARLLEAADRGMWNDPGELRERLEAAHLDAESDLELRDERPATALGRSAS